MCSIGMVMHVFNVPERYMTHPHIRHLQRIARGNQPINTRTCPFLQPSVNANEYMIRTHALYQPWTRLCYTRHRDFNKRMRLY